MHFLVLPLFKVVIIIFVEEKIVIKLFEHACYISSSNDSLPDMHLHTVSHALCFIHTALPISGSGNAAFKNYQCHITVISTSLLGSIVHCTSIELSKYASFTITHCN